MRKVVALSLLMGCFTFTSSVAYAIGSSGFELATNSARSLAKSNAVVADAEEPAAIIFNPANLTEVENNQLSSSASGIVPDRSYSGQNGGVDEDASMTEAFVPATYLTLSTPVKDLKVGMGLNSPFGLQTKYDSDGNFKYVGYFNEIITAGYNVSGAYRLAPWLSVGGGFTYLDSDLKQNAKFNSNFITQGVIPGFPFPLQDAPFEIDAEGHGYGWNAGLALRPREGHTIGLFYRSQVQVEYRGTLDVDTLEGPVMMGIFGGPSFHTSFDSDVTFPDSFTVGYNWQATDKLNIEVDAVWTNWSVFDHIDVAFGSSNAVLDALEPVEEQFKDSFSVLFGLAYDVNDTWTIHGGYLYYEMAANKETYSNVIPDGDRHGVSIGLEYKTKRFTFNVSYMAVFIAEEDISNDVGLTSGATVDGEYSGVAHLLSVGSTVRF